MGASNFSGFTATDAMAEIKSAESVGAAPRVRVAIHAYAASWKHAEPRDVVSHERVPPDTLVHNALTEAFAKVSPATAAAAALEACAARRQRCVPVNVPSSAVSPHRPICGVCVRESGLKTPSARRTGAEAPTSGASAVCSPISDEPVRYTPASAKVANAWVADAFRVGNVSHMSDKLTGAIHSAAKTNTMPVQIFGMTSSVAPNARIVGSGRTNGYVEPNDAGDIAMIALAKGMRDSTSTDVRARPETGCLFRPIQSVMPHGLAEGQGDPLRACAGPGIALSLVAATRGGVALVGDCAVAAWPLSEAAFVCCNPWVVNVTRSGRTGVTSLWALTAELVGCAIAGFRAKIAFNRRSPLDRALFLVDFDPAYSHEVGVAQKEGAIYAAAVVQDLVRQAVHPSRGSAVTRDSIERRLREDHGVNEKPVVSAISGFLMAAASVIDPHLTAAFKKLFKLASARIAVKNAAKFATELASIAESGTMSTEFVADAEVQYRGGLSRLAEPAAAGAGLHEGHIAAAGNAAKRTGKEERDPDAVIEECATETGRDGASEVGINDSISAAGVAEKASPAPNASADGRGKKHDEDGAAEKPGTDDGTVKAETVELDVSMFAGKAEPIGCAAAATSAATAGMSRRIDGVAASADEWSRASDVIERMAHKLAPTTRRGHKLRLWPLLGGSAGLVSV
eukprot:s1148_g26.t1